MKRFLYALAALPVALVLLLLLLPAKVDSLAWDAPPAPAAEGVYAPNEKLRGALLLAQGKVTGPEDVDVDGEGRVWAGLADGRIVRVLADGSVETVADTGGRPLGLEFDAAGNLVVCDAFKGLLSVTPAGEVRVLATEAGGRPFGFADDVDIARDGRIYFSDASWKFNQHDYELDLLETRPYGRLLVHDPATGETKVLLDNLYFANGVALSRNEDFVLVNETWRYRILRYWISGPRAGEHEVFIDNLPGFPDGVSGNRQGQFWVALPSPRKADLDFIHRWPSVKELVAKLPQALRPKAVTYGYVLALDEQGKVIAALHDTQGTHLREITSVEQAGDRLFLGTLTNDRIGVLPVAFALGEPQGYVPPPATP